MTAVPLPFSHPWVYSAKIADGKIIFRVEVTDFKPDAGDIEISGQATQEGGAFAPIYAIKNIPADAVEGDPDDEDQAGRSFVDVGVAQNSDYLFKNGQAITVFVRVSKAWATVIGQSTTGLPSSVEPGQPASEGTTWDDHLADAHSSSNSSSYSSSSSSSGGGGGGGISSFSHPWVYSAKITDGKITFRVEVTDFKPDAGDIEISGQATQEGGAFAPIYAIKNIPADAVEGDPDDEDQAGRSFVDVGVAQNSDYLFKNGQAVTVFVRVSKAWATVIGQSTTGLPSSVEPGQPASEGTTWDDHLADAHVSGS